MTTLKLVAASAALSLLALASAPPAAALNPSRTYKQRPDKYNMKYEAAKVRTNDGNAQLAVWDFPAKGKPVGTLLMAHNGEGNMADYLRRVDQLASVGYNVVTFDYRGFGESSDFEIDNKMFIYPHFQDDMETMIDYVRKKHAATFDLYGWGIGGGLALGVGWSRAEARRIIADTPFLSMEDLETRFSSWDEPMEVPFAGYDKRFEPGSAVTGGVAPGKNLRAVRIIVGSNDRLYKAGDYDAMLKAHKKLISKVFVVDNPDRKDNFRVDKAGYFGVFKSLLGS